jgi:hypothetical protein
MAEKVFSANGEEGWTGYFDCMLEDLVHDIEDDELIVGKTYYEGEKEPIPLKRIVNIDSLLDDLSEAAYDECGEYGDDPWPDLTDPEKQELENVIITFLEKYSPIRCWNVINVVEKQLTLEDIVSPRLPISPGACARETKP